MAKKYTIMFVPFNEGKILRFNISRVKIFIGSVFFLFLMLFTFLSLFSDLSFFQLKETHLSIKDTIRIFEKRIYKNAENYVNIKKNLENFILSYNPNFYQKFNIKNQEDFVENIDSFIDFLSDFSVFYEKTDRFFQTIPSIFPVLGGGKVTSPFGSRLDPFTLTLAFHPGIDIPKFPGTPIRSTADGKVLYADFSPSYGFYVMIEHAYGFTTTYAHMLNMPVVQRGDEIAQGKIIGYVGTSGRSIGYHLHYEIRNSDKLIDPVDFLFLKKRDF
ncbi:MAG TPA: hypothetical protein DHW82_05705 [Spirochaetia bacterium]|nr:hypothetical protein [Spirochaetia bacterium]